MERVRKMVARVREGIVEIKQGEVWAPADDVVIIGAGAEDSDGFVLVGKMGGEYITDTQVDAAYMLAKIADLGDKIAALGDINSWVISADNQVRGVNADAQQIGQGAKMLADEAREYKLR